MATHIGSRRWGGAAAVLGTVLALAGCATYEQLYDADGRLDEVAAEPVGRQLYENRCTLCHGLYEPTSYPMAIWDRQIRRYGAKAGLSKEERRLVTDRQIPETRKAGAPEPPDG